MLKDLFTTVLYIVDKLDKSKSWDWKIVLLGLPEGSYQLAS